MPKFLFSVPKWTNQLYLSYRRRSAPLKVDGSSEVDIKFFNRNPSFPPYASSISLCHSFKFSNQSYAFPTT